MANLAAFSIDGDASIDGSGNRGYDAVSGQVLDLQLENASLDILYATYAVWDTADASSPQKSLNAPTFQFAGSVSTKTPTNPGDVVNITFPVTLTACTYAIRCTAVTAAETHVFERIVCLRNNAAMRKMIPAETVQYEARGWSDEQNRMVDAVGATTVPSGSKAPVRVATAAALPANTRTGNVLEATANGVLAAIDGVTVVVGERVLVKNEATGANNGIYDVTSVGSGGSHWQLTRSSDADESADIVAAMTIPVSEGTANADLIFLLTTNAPITLNTTALAFSAPSAAAGGGWTDAGAVVHVTTVGDNVAIGATAMVGSEKLRVAGTSRLEGAVLITTGSLVVNGTALAGTEELRVIGQSSLEGLTAVTTGGLVTGGTALVGSEALRVVGTSRLEGDVTITADDIFFDTAATTPTISQNAMTGTGTGQGFTIQAQSNTANAAATGGAFTLSAGDASGSAVATFVGGTLSLIGGAASGSAASGTFTGGDVQIRGGTALGGGGTQTGGNTIIRPGGGSDADGKGRLEDFQSETAILSWYRNPSNQVNLFFFGTHPGGAENVQSMDKGIYFGNADVVPTGNASGGGFLYAEAGALKWRGSGGTITTLGAAEPHCPRCDRDFVLEYDHAEYGSLTVCIWCLVETLGTKGVPHEEFVMEKNLRGKQVRQLEAAAAKASKKA